MSVAEKLKLTEMSDKATKKILVIDDEEGICNSLVGILDDEGFHGLSAHGLTEALAILERETLALVFLDIWMPGTDGIEALQIIKSRWPDLPVIMMSGHATISTALRATKLGAHDFIEKPLDLHKILTAIQQVVGEGVESSPIIGEVVPEDNPLLLGQKFDVSKIVPVAFEYTGLQGASRPQKTLAASLLIYGHGVHTGQKSGLILEPLPAGSGIHFVRLDGTSPVPAHVNYVQSTGYATTIRLGGGEAGTIEHLMSALHAYGISNLLIKCNGEVPVLDGSAMEFCKLFDDTGVKEQDAPWYDIAIKEPITIQGGSSKEFIRIEPSDEFVIDYTLEYPEPIGKQHFVFTLSDIEAYKREIASARTFAFIKDVGAMQTMGLAQGGRFDNFVLIGEEGVINANLRYPDEPVRHKILDVIGDLFLLGRPLAGKVTACMTGHSDNIQLLLAIRGVL